jgi:hypothetical protein
MIGGEIPSKLAEKSPSAGIFTWIFRFMKSKLLLVVFLVCFSLFLLIGFRASQAVFSEEGAPASGSSDPAGPVLLQAVASQPPPTDPFILIVLVDDLTALNPTLNGVWLSRATDGGQGSLFFPIFPSQAEDGDQRDINLRGAFWLDGSLQLSQQFQTILRDRNLVWNQVVLLDQNALEETGLILGELNPEYKPLNSVGLAGLTYTVENRLAVQANQAQYIHELCSQFPLPAHNELLQRFLEGFAGHLVVADTTPLTVTQSWSQVSYCLFPTLTLSTP